MEFPWGLMMMILTKTQVKFLCKASETYFTRSLPTKEIERPVFNQDQLLCKKSLKFSKNQAANTIGKKRQSKVQENPDKPDLLSEMKSR